MITGNDIGLALFECVFSFDLNGAPNQGQPDTHPDTGNGYEIILSHLRRHEPADLGGDEYDQKGGDKGGDAPDSPNACEDVAQNIQCVLVVDAI